ncbi:hypothetical protein B0H12DRAFT_1230782 [Mycena haematopus]|nr:hypothetical protein B0H12DRAFT_1230782 [Mycena haematopus]
MSLTIPPAVLADPAYADSIRRLKALMGSAAFAASPYLRHSFEWKKGAKTGMVLHERPKGPVDDSTPLEQYAFLRIIGTMSRTGLAVGPAGNYKPTFSQPFAKAKYVALLGRPTNPVYAAAWDVSITNLHQDVEQTVCEKSSNFIVNEDGHEVLRLTQPMFALKGKHIEWTKKWPAPSDVAAKFEETLVTHDVRVLKVYDQNQALLPPDEIPAKLAGATVIATFRCFYYDIKRDSGVIHSITAEISELHILHSGRPDPPVVHRANPGDWRRPKPTSQRLADQAGVPSRVAASAQNNILPQAVAAAYNALPQQAQGRNAHAVYNGALSLPHHQVQNEHLQAANALYNGTLSLPQHQVQNGHLPSQPNGAPGEGGLIFPHHQVQNELLAAHALYNRTLSLPQHQVQHGHLPSQPNVPLERGGSHKIEPRFRPLLLPERTSGGPSQHRAFNSMALMRGGADVLPTDVPRRSGASAPGFPHNGAATAPVTTGHAIRRGLLSPNASRRSTSAPIQIAEPAVFRATEQSRPQSRQGIQFDGAPAAGALTFPSYSGVAQSPIYQPTAQNGAALQPTAKVGLPSTDQRRSKSTPPSPRAAHRAPRRRNSPIKTNSTPSVSSPLARSASDYATISTMTTQGTIVQTDGTNAGHNGSPIMGANPQETVPPPTTPPNRGVLPPPQTPRPQRVSNTYEGYPVNPFTVPSVRHSSPHVEGSLADARGVVSTPPLQQEQHLPNSAEPTLPPQALRFVHTTSESFAAPANTAEAQANDSTSAPISHALTATLNETRAASPATTIVRPPTPLPLFIPDYTSDYSAMSSHDLTFGEGISFDNAPSHWMTIGGFTPPSMGKWDDPVVRTHSPNGSETSTQSAGSSNGTSYSASAYDQRANAIAEYKAAVDFRRSGKRKRSFSNEDEEVPSRKARPLRRIESEDEEDEGNDAGNGAGNDADEPLVSAV